MIFHQLFEKDSSTYTYILADEVSREGIIIDPVFEMVERDLKLIEELGIRLLYTIETHVHADHITGSGKIRTITGAKSVVGKYSGAECADIFLEHNQVLKFGSHEITALETPGHTNGCTSYLVGNRVFTGDALLIRGCGRTDFQQGSAEKLWHSLSEVLFKLPLHTLVYPGHDYRGHTSSSIQQEIRWNPRTAKGKDGFIDIMQNLKLDQPKRIHEAVPANLECGNIKKDSEAT